MTIIENIKNTYSKIEKNDRESYKSLLKEYLESEGLNMSMSSLRTGWFSRFEIPKNHQQKVLRHLQNYVKNKYHYRRVV